MTFLNGALRLLPNAPYRKGNLWQRRFWEHLIRDEEDFIRQVDYIHFNPVKHGLVQQVKEWPYSTFYRYVLEGVYPLEWGSWVEWYC